MRRIFAALLLTAMASFAADVTGVWHGEAIIEGDSQPVHLILKQDGNALTGSGGPDETQQYPMKNGKADGGKLSFDVMVDERVYHVEIAPDGAALKGTIEVRVGEGNRSGGTIKVTRIPRI